MTKTPLLSVRQLAKQVMSGEATLDILKQIDLTINYAETLAIRGVSGSGKTTLLGLLAGLDLPTKGEIEVDQIVLTQLSEDERAAWRSQRVGFVFQSFHLLPSFNALENVALPLELMGDKNAKLAAQEILEQVGLGARILHYPLQLSGGEQQRVAIARAFVHKPKILFADEPTGNLDQKTAENIIELLFELNTKQQTTLVLVTHDEHLAQLCQRQVLLENGILHELTP